MWRSARARSAAEDAQEEALKSPSSAAIPGHGQRDDIGSGLTIQSRRDGRPDCVCGPTQRVCVEVGIAGGSRRLCMAEKLANDRKPKRRASPE